MTTLQRVDWFAKIQERMKSGAPGSPVKPARADEDANPNCARCHGFGWVQSAQYDNHWFSCPCVAQEREKLTQFKPDLSRVGLTDSEFSLTWDAIKPEISEGKKVLDALRPKYTQGWGMVFFWGTWGQAKTLAGKVLVATAFRDGKRAAYANMEGVLDDIKLAFDEKYQSIELLRRMEYWNSLDVLFLDELDKCNGTDWAESRMFQLLDQRYARAIREESLTVIASNRSHDQLDGYLKSRLADRRLGPVVYLNGVDGRQVAPDGWKF